MREKFYIYYNASVRIRKVFALPAILALGCMVESKAADWLNYPGDPQRDGWQRHEKTLTPSNVQDLKLIWKLKLDDGVIATPAILGHWITNRGTKELVFAVSGSGAVYAIDADLGRLFWQRHLDNGSTTNPAPPTLAPGPPPPVGTDEVDDDDDIRQEIRPVYVIGGGGKRYRLHPTTGVDLKQTTVFPDAPVNRALTARWEGGWTFTAGPANVVAAQGGHRIWSSTAMVAPAQPVIANGVVYVLAKGSLNANAVLFAFEAKTGKRLYSSGDSIGSSATVSGLAIANGHICLGTRDGTLYCFGFPVDL